MISMGSYFASQMAQARTSAGLSKYKLAQLAGLSEAYIHHLEGGKNLPSAAALAKLAEAIGVDLDVMQGWVDADRIGEDGVRRVTGLAGAQGADLASAKAGNPGHFMISASQAGSGQAKDPEGVTEALQPVLSLGDNLKVIPMAGHVRLPVFGVVSCGDPAWMPETAIDFLEISATFTNGAEAAIQVRGSSMVGHGFFDGDMLFVKRLDGERPPSSKIVIASIDGEFTCAVYRADALGEYLEKHPAGGEPERHPIKNGTRLCALVVAHQRLL